MSLGSVLGSTFEQGVSGIRAGLQGMDKAAQQIASGAYGEPARRGDGVGVTPSASANPPVDATDQGGFDGLAEAVVRLEQHARDVQAAAKVVDTADAVLGALLGYQDD